MRSFQTLLILFLFFNTNIKANPVFVYGKIFDAENNMPLVGANIIYGRNQGSISDEQGFYQLNLIAGQIDITFKYIGYISETKRLNFKAGDTILLNVGLMPSINEIDQLVVSANKAEQKLSDLTVSMTVIKAYSPGNNHISDPQELINKTPGIEVLDGQASIRGGSGFSYGAGSRVMALIDGLPMISADAGNIKWQFLPLENLSQVEIIKGASSVLYGSSALNGVINFRTADATNQPRTKFFIESGIFDNPSNKEWKWWNSPRMFTNTSLSHLQKFGNTDVGIAANMSIDNGYRKLNDEKLWRFNIRLKHHSEKIEGLKYGINLNSGLTRKTDFILWENSSDGALKQSETTASEFLGTFLAIDPFIYYKRNTRVNHEFRMRVQSTSNDFPEGRKTSSSAVSTYSEYLYQNQILSFVILNVGLSENYSKIYSSFYSNHTNLNVSGFSQIDVEAGERLKLVAGVRLEKNILNGEADRTVPIFRTGVNYKIANYTFLRASFGQGYRYPSIAEKFASTSLGSVRIFANSELKPESGWNSEVGVKQALAIGNLQGMVDVATFYSQNKDMIEYVFGLYAVPSGGMPSTLYDFGFQAWNTEHSSVYGAETEFQLNYSSGNFYQSFTGGYIYLYPVETNNSTNNNAVNYLKYRRKHSASLGWNIRKNKIDLGINLFAKSRILDIDKVFVGIDTRESILPGFYDYWQTNNKGYFLTDLVLAYRISENIKISVAVKNLFNAEYMGRPGDIMPHRNFSLRLSGIF